MRPIRLNDAKALVSRQRQVCRALGEKLMFGINIRSSNEKPGLSIGLGDGVRPVLGRSGWGSRIPFGAGPTISSGFAVLA